MKFRDFQNQRAAFSHSILKNGVAMRLPEESERYVSTRKNRQPQIEVVPPTSITENLHYAAKTWLRGCPPESSPVSAMLTDLLSSMEHIDGFSLAPGHSERATQLLGAADRCSLIMARIERRVTPESGEWMGFLNDFRLICEKIEQMEARHPNFGDWLISKFVVQPF